MGLKGSLEEVQSRMVDSMPGEHEQQGEKVPCICSMELTESLCCNEGRPELRLQIVQPSVSN